MKTVVIPGRWQAPDPTNPRQPMLHEGHKALITRGLQEADLVIILVRDTKPTEKDPYPASERAAMIRREYLDEMRAGRLQVMAIPDPGGDLTFMHGREVGWKVEAVELPSDVEQVSATALRESMRDGQQPRG